MKKGFLVFGLVPAVLLSSGAVVSMAQPLTSGAGDGGRLQASGKYVPPSCTGLFTDVACPGTYTNWIEQLYNDGITGGCQAPGDPLAFCPDMPIPRSQMAVFVERAMRGTASWPPHTVLAFHHPAAEADSDANSGKELLDLVAAIPSIGSEVPSATTPWLVKLGPGTWDLGSGSLTLPDFTALEGAGEGITVLTAGGYSTGTNGTVILGDHDRLSQVTVNNTGGATYSIAVYLPSGANAVRIEHATLEASSPSNASGATSGLRTAATSSFSMVDCDVSAHGAMNNYGIIAYTSSGQSRLHDVRVTVYGSSDTGGSDGFYSSEASPVITDSRISVSDGLNRYGLRAVDGGAGPDVRNSVIEVAGGGRAVYIYGISGELHGNTLSGATGVWNQGTGSVVNITASNISGTENSIYNWSGCTLNVGASRLIGTAGGLGTTTCLGNYTATAFLADACP